MHVRFAEAEDVQVGPIDEDGFLPRGFHSDRSDREPDNVEEVFEVTEDALDGSGGFGRVSAAPAGLSFGGV
jgi:hypothetical protein